MPMSAADSAPVISNKDFERVLEMLRSFQFALDEEIAAVKERPSQDTLETGVFVPRKDDPEEHDYVFKSGNAGLRFAEKIRARVGDRQVDVRYVDAREDEITLRFPENLGPSIPQMDIEWENDFVLRKIQEQLHLILSAERDEQFRRIAEVFFPKPPSGVEPEKTAYARKLYEIGEIDIRHDGNRNAAQQEAIQKSLYNPVSYVWGPPGTGKTSTLGYVMANFMLQGKRVLFVSNTNRAVDVGVMSAIDALLALDEATLIADITRFGDIALSAEALERVHHARQADLRRTKLRQRGAQLQDLVTRFKNLQDEAEAVEIRGETLPEALEIQLDAALDAVRRNGGLRKLEELLASLPAQLANVDFFEVINKKLVATTLARVCTSDMFYDMEFDAVVVDESSMAALPYLAVMASRCKGNMVLAGDPMQLPPIAVSQQARAREVLEQDIFAFASGATQVSELFTWHDYNPLQTCFFDIQYRLNEDLAEIISDVFYEGRLKTGKVADKGPARGGRSYEVIDTAFFEPVLVSGKSDYGFNPKNEMHQAVLGDLVQQLVVRDLIPMSQIGVIVPFRSAVWDLKLTLRKKGLTDVEVGTIHTFQGREKRIIVFDTVMSGAMDRGRKRHFSVRPFDETKNGLSVPRLLNVAFSRAKEKLYILADMDHIGRVYGEKFLGKLLRRLSGG
jgi:hypothetical protein